MGKVKKRIGDIFILASKQLRSTLQNGDTASETDECLREFQANIATAENDQMAGKAIEFECLYVRERFRGTKAGDVGDSRGSAEIQEHAVALQTAHSAVAQSNLNGLRSNEAALAQDNLGAAFPVFVNVQTQQTAD